MKKYLLTTLALTALVSTNALALESLSDEEASNSYVEGIPASAIVPLSITKADGSTITVSVVDSNRIAQAMQLTPQQADQRPERVNQAMLDANMAANNVAIDRDQLRSALNATILKQDQAAQALANAFTNGVAQGGGNNRLSAGLALDGVGSIVFKYLDGSAHTFICIVDDGCRGPSICFHTETRTIQTTKNPLLPGLGSIQIIMGK